MLIAVFVVVLLLFSFLFLLLLRETDKYSPTLANYLTLENNLPSATQNRIKSRHAILLEAMFHLRKGRRNW